MADTKIVARPWQPQDLIDDLQGFDGWEKQPKVKRFADFGVQKWWRKGGTAAEEDMLPL